MDSIKSLETLQAFATGLTEGAYAHFVQGKYFESKGLKTLGKKYVDHANEEMNWVGKFFTRINDLGGDSLIEKRGERPLVKDAVEYLKADLEIQKQGVAALYEVMPSLAGDPTTYDLFKAYLADEEQDQYWSEEQVGLVELLGRENWLKTQL